MLSSSQSVKLDPTAKSSAKKEQRRSDPDTLARRLMHILALRRNTCGRRCAEPAVVFDGKHIWLKALRDCGVVKAKRIAWASVDCVCFKDNGPDESDTIYLRVNLKRVYAIPLECSGGCEFWRALRDRGGYPAYLHAMASMSTSGGIYSWFRDSKNLRAANVRPRQKQ